MRKFLLRTIRGIAKIALCIVVLFCIVFGWSWWELKQLHAFCNEVHEGAAFSSLPALAEKYGFKRHWVEHGIKEGEGENWITFVPATSSMGEIACAIRYNQSGVISAKMEP